MVTPILSCLVISSLFMLAIESVKNIGSPKLCSLFPLNIWVATKKVEKHCSTIKNARLLTAETPSCRFLHVLAVAFPSVLGSPDKPWLPDKML